MRSAGLETGATKNAPGDFAEEAMDEVDEQDEDYDDFEKKAAGLVELLDHVVAEIFGGFELRATCFVVSRWRD